MNNEIKNIAFVGNSSFSNYKFRLGVMKHFVAQGHEVFSIAPKDEYSSLFEKEGIHYIPIDIQTKSKNVLSDIKVITKLLNIYKVNKIDFIFHYTIKPIIYGSIAARIRRLPSVAVTTGLGYTFQTTGFFYWFISNLYKVSLRKVKEVWFLNSHDRDVFLKNKIINESKSFILPSEGVDTEHYTPREKQRKGDMVKFLLLSRLIKGKGVPEYMEAADILMKKGVNAEFQLLGKVEAEDSPIAVPLSDVMKWHNQKSINYLGEAIDIREYIAESDCVVLPTYYNEGVPRCLMEGMSMGKPIITTDNVGSSELIRDGVNGFVCNKRDVDDLADKMEKMINLSATVREEMGKNGRKLILNEFDEQVIIKIYHNKFEELFNK